MRTLTSIESTTNVLLDLEFHIKASDASTTWIFTNQDIVQYPNVDWEINFMGGFGKPSNYKITLATSMTYVTSYMHKLINGESFLKVYTNSDNFTPHVGRVRNINRFAHNPNIIELSVYDKFLDGNSKIPRDAITDSYDTVHPEVLNDDMGYPLYYGKHTRPFYMTPVDCDIAVLYGPRNVSSGNHQTSLFFIPDPQNENEKLLFGLKWEQQSTSTNIASNEIPFEVRNTSFIQDYYGKIVPPGNGSIQRTGNLEGVSVTSYYTSSFDFNPKRDSSFFQVFEPIQYTAKNGVGVTVTTWGGFYRMSPFLDIQRTSKMFYSLIFSDGIIDTTSVSVVKIVGEVSSGDDSSWASIIFAAVAGSNHLIGSEDIIGAGGDATVLNGFFTQENESVLSIGAGVASGYFLEGATAVFSLTLLSQVKSNQYRNYSVYGSQVTCSDIAISENPNGIVRDLTSWHTNLEQELTQNSEAQSYVTDYNFQCFFGERQLFTDILEEFGDITGTYYWIGDSGYLNYRVYQESATATDSIDYTITPNDIIRDSMVIKDNPLGVTTYSTKKGSRIKLDYDYNFTTGEYEATKVAEKSNNAYCESADAAGIKSEITRKTKYIKEADTASYYIANLVRKSTLDETILEAKLPARFFGMEIADIIQIAHPAIIGSESLFQVTKVKPDYEKGEIWFSSNEILNL